MTKNLTRDLTNNLTKVIDAKIQGEITKLKYELQDKQKKFLSEMHNLVDVLVTEVKDNQNFRDITTGNIQENKLRINNLEKKVFGVAIPY